MGHMERKVAPTDKDLSSSIPLNRCLEGGVAHEALLTGCFPHSVPCDGFWSHCYFGPAQDTVLQAASDGADPEHGFMPHPALSPQPLGSYNAFAVSLPREALWTATGCFDWPTQVGRQHWAALKGS